MMKRYEGTAGAKLRAVYVHRTSDPDKMPPDRYLYSLERTVTKPSGADLEYGRRYALLS